MEFSDETTSLVKALKCTRNMVALISRHFGLWFDDGGCYELIARDVHIEVETETRLQVPLEAEYRQVVKDIKQGYS